MKERHMKKISIIILCLLVFLGAGLGVYFYSQKGKLAVEDVLAEGPLAYIHFSDIQKNLKEIAASPVWQSLSGLNYDRLLSSGQISQEQREFIESAKARFMDVTTHPLFQKVFGQEVALAVYPADIDLISLSSMDISSLAGFMEKALSSIVLIARIPPDVQMAELFTGVVRQYGADVTTETLDYRKQKIHIIHFQSLNMKVAYVRVKDLLILGVGEKAARMSLDVLGKDKPALTGDPLFKQARTAFIDAGGMTGYWNLEKFFALLKEQASAFTSLASQEKGTERLDDPVQDVLDANAGFKTGSFSVKLGALTRLQTAIFFNRQEMSADVARFYDTCAPVENKTILFVPKETIGYHWGTCLDLGFFWKQIKKEIARIEDQSEKYTAQDRLDAVEEFLGLKIEEDLLPAIGNEFGGFLTGIQSGGMFPIPKLLLFLKVEDKNTIDDLLANVTENPFFVLKEDTYAGIPIRYMSLPFGEDLQPAYAYVDNYLLVSINRPLLKEAMDTRQDKSRSLLASESFRSVHDGGTDKNINIQFFKTDDLLQQLEETFGWANNWVSTTDKSKLAFKAGAEKRLADTKNGVPLQEGELKDMQVRVDALDKQIAELGAQGLPKDDKEKELQSLKEEMDNKQKDLVAAREQVAELEEVIQGYEKHTKDAAQRQMLLDDLVYPLFKGLRSIKAVGAQTTVDEGSMRTTVLFKTGE
ncbi:MAG TPA: hypothetical protein DD723_04600 [Candidatus Omnitrophica bacterium]|nr:hypothetical protein [Candidatus Omnitrophota bacterium]